MDASITDGEKNDCIAVLRTPFEATERFQVMHAARDWSPIGFDKSVDADKNSNPMCCFQLQHCTPAGEAVKQRVGKQI